MSGCHVGRAVSLAPDELIARGGMNRVSRPFNKMGSETLLFQRRGNEADVHGVRLVEPDRAGRPMRGRPERQKLFVPRRLGKHEVSGCRPAAVNRFDLISPAPQDGYFLRMIVFDRRYGGRARPWREAPTLQCL